MKDNKKQPILPKMNPEQHKAFSDIVWRDYERRKSNAKSTDAHKHFFLPINNNGTIIQSDTNIEDKLLKVLERKRKRK